MNKRSENLHTIRPIIASAKIHEAMSADEKFQNETKLR